MLLLNINEQPITIQANRFKVIISHRQVKIIDVNTKDITLVDAKAFKSPGSPDTLPFTLLPETFDKLFLEDLAEKNRLGLSTMQIAGSLASWVKKGLLINTKGIYTKSNIPVSL